MNTEERRIGVYICHCEPNIAGTVDIERLHYLALTPFLLYASLVSEGA